MKNERKGQRAKGKGNVALRAAVHFSLFTFLFSLMSCGFHLRGASSVVLPPEYSVMRVTMSGGQAYPPLLTEVRHALLVLGSVRLTEDISATVPVLTLYGESFQNEVLSLDSSGRINSYLLNYQATYSLAGSDGKALLPTQSVKLQRELSFDRLNVLASEKQGEFLQAEMRRDAAQQILRRLASLNFPKPDSTHAAQP